MNNDLTIFTQELKSRKSCYDKASEHTKLDSKGRGSCPLPGHKDTHPSFSVNLKKDYWTCFAEGISGDVIDLTMIINNVSFIEAIKMLAEEVGLEMPNKDPTLIKRLEKQQQIQEVLTSTAHYYHNCLMKNHQVLEYLVNTRGLLKNILKICRHF